jgi:hypothetical protein
MHGWDTVDLIKCMGFAGRIHVLLRPRPQWLNTVLTLITRPGAAGWRADDAKELETTLPVSEFTRQDYDGGVAVFTRRSVQTDTLPRMLKVIPEPPYNAKNSRRPLN